jgi:FtsH-binding integral membrane protein
MDHKILDYTMDKSANDGVVVKSFLSKVFTWMTAALVISGVTAYLFASTASLQQLIMQEVAGHVGFTTLGYVILFAPIAFILVMNFGMEKLSLQVLLALFLLYSICMGMTLSVLLLVYAQALIVQTFLISAGTFGFMAFLGATTKTDLTKMGTYLYMGLFGIIIASVIHAFTGGSTFLIDIAGVIVFTGLTSYKVQQLKNMALEMPGDTVQTQKMALMGALTLYITFINLFLTLLRLAGGRK